MFTEYKFSSEQITAAMDTAVASLALSQPGVDPAAFAISTIAARLRAAPATYLQYGPYWWAVKRVLAVGGEDFGAQADDIIRLEYGEQFSAYGALIAAEQFRDFYRSTFLAGTAQFWLDGGEAESYVLFDADMEARRLGAGGARVSVNLNSVELENEPDAEAGS